MWIVPHHYWQKLSLKLQTLQEGSLYIYYYVKYFDVLKGRIKVGKPRCEVRQKFEIARMVGYY